MWNDTNISKQTWCLHLNWIDSKICVALVCFLLLFLRILDFWSLIRFILGILCWILLIKSLHVVWSISDPVTHSAVWRVGSSRDILTVCLLVRLQNGWLVLFCLYLYSVAKLQSSKVKQDLIIQKCNGVVKSCHSIKGGERGERAILKGEGQPNLASAST